jgi:caa(3)-type oxidase subunit IV
MSKEDVKQREDDAAKDDATKDDAAKDDAAKDDAEAKTDRDEPKKAEPKAAEPKKAEPKKAEEKAAEPKKAEPKKAEAKRAEPKKSGKQAKAEPRKAAREAISERPPAKAKATHAAAHGHHKPDRRQYLAIFGWLAGLTILEVGVAFTESVVGKTALVIALVGLALAKAGCVALFYMHLKHETTIMRWTVAFPMLFPALYAFILIAEGIYRSLWGGGA